MRRRFPWDTVEARKSPFRIVLHNVKSFSARPQSFGQSSSSRALGATNRSAAGTILRQPFEIMIRLVWGQASPKLRFNEYALGAFVVKAYEVRARPFFVCYLGLYPVYGADYGTSEPHRLLQRAPGRLRIGQNMPQRFNSNILYAIGEPGRNMCKQSRFV